MDMLKPCDRDLLCGLDQGHRGGCHPGEIRGQKVTEEFVDEMHRAYEPLPLEEDWDYGAQGLASAFGLATITVGIGVLVYSLVQWL